jgi:hypothetical protein
MNKTKNLNPNQLIKSPDMNPNLNLKDKKRKRKIKGKSKKSIEDLHQTKANKKAIEKDLLLNQVNKRSFQRKSIR